MFLRTVSKFRPSLFDEPGEWRVHHLEVVAAVGVHRDEGGHRHALPVDRRLQVEVWKENITFSNWYDLMSCIGYPTDFILKDTAYKN